MSNCPGCSEWPLVVFMMDNSRESKGALLNTRHTLYSEGKTLLNLSDAAYAEALQRKLHIQVEESESVLVTDQQTKFLTFYK